MRRGGFDAQLVDCHLRPGESLIEFLVRSVDAQVLFDEVLKMLLRVAVEFAKSAVQSLQP